MVKYLIFDFNGTIADSKSFVIGIFNQLAEKYGFEKMAEGDIAYLSTLTIMERVKLLKIPVYKIPQFRNEYKEIHKSSLHKLKPVDGMYDVLRSLREWGVSLAIISSHSKDNIHRFLQQNELDFFQSYPYLSRLVWKTPKVEQNLKIAKHEAIYIGDEIRDMIACKKAGLPAAAATWGYDSVELMSKANPEFILQHPFEIMTKICMSSPQHVMPPC